LYSVNAIANGHKKWYTCSECDKYYELINGRLIESNKFTIIDTIKVKCVDAKSNCELGEFEAELHNGKVDVPALKEAFNATTLLVGKRDGLLMETDAAGLSNYVFKEKSVTLYRRQPADFENHSSGYEFTWPNYLNRLYTWFLHFAKMNDLIGWIGNSVLNSHK
jgi:hypothetical protein